MINLEEVREKLKEVFDPELGVNVVDLGLIYELAEPEEGDLYVKMTLTTPGCPMHDTISQAVEWAVMQVFGVATVKVDVVWDPPWSMESMSDDAKRQLGM